MERIGKTTTHRKYKIVQIIQDSGRKTFDIQYPNGEPCEWALESLAVAKATINSEIEQRNQAEHAERLARTKQEQSA